MVPLHLLLTFQANNPPPRCKRVLCLLSTIAECSMEMPWMRQQLPPTCEQVIEAVAQLCCPPSDAQCH
jgi:hypothetical protein